MESSKLTPGTGFDSTLDLLEALPGSSATKAECSWRMLFSFTKRSHLGILAGALAAAAFVAALRTLLSVILGQIFDLISQFGQGARTGHSTLADVSTWCLVLVGMGIGSWTANSSFLSLWVVFGELQANEAREQVFSSLLSKQVEWFESLKGGVEGLHARIHTQTREFQLGTSQVLGFVICDAVTSCASLGIALYYSWKLALVLLSTLPVSFLILCIVTRDLDSELWSQTQYLQRASTYAAAAINGIDLVAAFGGHGKELSKYGSTLMLAARHFSAQARCNSIQMGYIAFWSISIFVLGFWYGLVLVGQGISPGHIVTTFYAILTAFQGVEAFAGHWLVLFKGKSAGSFLTNLRRTEQNVDLKSVQDFIVTLGECIGDVRLDKVDFAYQSDSSKKCLSEVSMHFPPQQMTFLIGDSGSGKSTICALMAKLLTPTSGEISIDGYPVHQLHDECLRRHITLVHQRSPVIHDTFFNNVALGHGCTADANASQVRQACEFARLDSTISNLRCGMSTVLTPDGHQLSGGQRQKLALARARLRDPAVLILDEPTSALDPASQIRVMKAIREWRRGKTTIIVTHDLSNIENRDFVYILKEGAVFRQGRMQELRNVAAAFCHPESKTAVDRTNFVATSSVRQSAANRFSQVYGKHSLARFSRASFCATSLMPPNVGSPQTHTGRNAMRPLSGWQVTAPDFEDKQQQFSKYLDCRFDIPETNEKASKPSWQFELGDGVQHTKDNMPSEKTISGDWSVVVSECESARSSRESKRGAKISDPEQCSMSTGLIQDPLHRPVDSLYGVVSTIWPSLGLRDRITLIFAIILCLVAAAATPAFSYCLAQLLSSMWAKTGKEEGVRWAVYLVGIAVVDGLCTGGGHYLFETLGQIWVDNLRKEALRKILDQPRSWFQETQTTPGKLSQCLDRNAQEMSTIMGKILPIAIVVISITSISIIWSMVICWRLTLVTLSSLPLLMVAVRAYSFVSSRWELRCLDAAAGTDAILREILLNFEFVRIFALESYFSGKQSAASGATLRSGLKRSLYLGPLFGLYQSITMPLMALVFYYGTLVATKDARTSVDNILQVINLLLFSIGTTFGLLNGLPQLTASKVAAADLLGYVHLAKGDQNPAYLPDQPYSLLPILMRNLDFAPDRMSPKLFKGLSLDIQPGRSLAIAGPSGSGKSTILSLLLGINTPNETLQNEPKDSRLELTYGNVSYANIDPRHLRSMMAYVPQRPFLFPATIADNIAYGMPKSCARFVRDSVVQAAKEAGIHDFIESLPDAYDTLVGDGGQALSGGQAQLVNVARALARKPQLLIMDEPTSALDAESAAAVRSAIESLIQSSRGKDNAVALVVATHSVKMLQLVDDIVVLDGGIKVEQGDYATLEANRGPLWQLVTYGGECDPSRFP